MSSTPKIVDLPVDLLEKGPIPNLDAVFLTESDSLPSFYVRSPGRVNLIGEHIDYCGYSVLPMAIEQCVTMAVCKNKRNLSSLVVTNTDSKFERFSCDISDLKVDKDVPKWYNYVLAGILGIRDRFRETGLVGMVLTVHGTVPPSAGLSSSSALVCAAALATAHLNGHSISKLEIANLCAKSERYVGTEGGGMDQAICFLGEKGTAKLIDFNPLKATDIKLPVGYVFVIANSLADVNKAATSQYNTRVVECRLASKILAKYLGLDWTNIRILGEVQTSAGIDAIKMADYVRENLHSEPYSRQEVCDILGLSTDEFVDTCLNQNTIHLKEFKLQQRAFHVYTESQRVQDFKAVCDEGSADAPFCLSTLMNESHTSCRDEYECSHPDLDELVKVALNSGALGSRLTGAGWGGCAVSIVPVELVDSFLSKVEERYYGVNEERKKRVTSSLFVSLPADGALIYRGHD